jgi:hypothetical protein
MREAESLSDAVVRQLIVIPQSHYCNMALWPCQVTLLDGRILPRVLVRCSKQYYEDNDLFIPASQVSAISESQFRLPARWANIVYAHGESGMDYFMFRVFFRDKTHIDVTIGSTIDFIPYPEGKTVADVFTVEPWGRLTQPFARDTPLPPTFYRCVFRP